MQTVIINPGAAVTAIRTAKVNGLTATFSKKEANVWQAQVKEAVNGRYEVTGTAVDSSGSWPLWSVTYYGVSLITDRTQADLDNDTARAYIDHDDLNRLEGAVQWIAEHLQDAGYPVRITERLNWLPADVRTQSEMDRLRDNINNLRSAYVTVSTTPRTPASITYSSINQANEIEQILADLYQLINGMESQYRYSGEAIAGEE